MPDIAGPLAVASQPCRGQRIEWHALAAEAKTRLADARPAEHGLQRPDVEVLAGVAAGHDRELRRLELELLDAAGLEQGEQARTA